MVFQGLGLVGKLNFRQFCFYFAHNVERKFVYGFGPQLSSPNISSCTPKVKFGELGQASDHDTLVLLYRPPEDLEILTSDT